MNNNNNNKRHTFFNTGYGKTMPPLLHSRHRVRSRVRVRSRRMNKKSRSRSRSRRLRAGSRGHGRNAKLAAAAAAALGVAGLAGLYFHNKNGGGGPPLPPPPKGYPPIPPPAGYRAEMDEQEYAALREQTKKSEHPLPVSKERYQELIRSFTKSLPKHLEDLKTVMKTMNFPPEDAKKIVPERWDRFYYNLLLPLLTIDENRRFITAVREIENVTITMPPSKEPSNQGEWSQSQTTLSALNLDSLTDYQIKTIAESVAFYNYELIVKLFVADPKKK